MTSDMDFLPQLQKDPQATLKMIRDTNPVLKEIFLAVPEADRRGVEMPSRGRDIKLWLEKWALSLKAAADEGDDSQQPPRPAPAPRGKQPAVQAQTPGPSSAGAGPRDRSPPPAHPSHPPPSHSYRAAPGPSPSASSYGHGMAPGSPHSHSHSDEPFDPGYAPPPPSSHSQSRAFSTRGHPTQVRADRCVSAALTRGSPLLVPGSCRYPLGLGSTPRRGLSHWLLKCRYLSPPFPLTLLIVAFAPSNSRRITAGHCAACRDKDGVILRQREQIQRLTALISGLVKNLDDLTLETRGELTLALS